MRISVVSLVSGTYLLSTPFCGMLIDRWPDATNGTMLFGSLLATFAILLMGPSPLLPLAKSVPTLCTAFALMGAAISPLWIPAFQHCIRAAKFLIQWSFRFPSCFTESAASTNLARARAASFRVCFKHPLHLGKSYTTYPNYPVLQCLSGCHFGWRFCQLAGLRMDLHIGCLPALDMGIPNSFGLIK